MGSGTVVLFENRHSDLCNRLGRAMQATGTGTMVLKAQTTVPVPHGLVSDTMVFQGAVHLTHSLLVFLPGTGGESRHYTFKYLVT